MAALTADTTRPVRPMAGGVSTYSLPLAGYTNRGAGNVAFTCYKGAVIACDVTDTDGYFGPMDFTAASPDFFGGIAMENVAVTSANTADGSRVITVARDGVWGFPKASLAVTDVGAVVYASNTNDLTTTALNNMSIGRIVEVDATYAWVDISTHVNVPL